MKKIYGLSVFEGNLKMKRRKEALNLVFYKKRMEHWLKLQIHFFFLFFDYQGASYQKKKKKKKKLRLIY